ncbi:MAG: hypothetical protein IJC56_04260 [Clostridia bacterium]|nr:hypothetical protein [Clostridia bacterium]
MKLRRALIFALLAICLVMTGCGSETASDAPAPGEKAAEATPVPASMEVAAHIQAAIDASARLTGNLTAILPGEGIITTNGYSPDNLSMYSMYDLKKLSAAALTNSGELYYWNVKLADNVKDVVSVNSSLRAGWFTTNDGALYSLHDYSHSSNNTDNMYVKREREGAAPVVAMGTEAEALFVVYADGTISSDGNPDQWGKCSEFTTWGNNIAVIDASRVMNRDDRSVADYVTVAAITADGRTLAAGDFAEDILAMGELSYITMNDGVIIGLRTDGTLAVAGPYVDELNEIGVTSLVDIAGVVAGGGGISAIDKNGVCYFAYRFPNGHAEFDVVSINGEHSENAYATLYTGSYSYYYDSEKGWIDYNENPRIAPADAPMRAGYSVEHPLTEEYVKAYLDELFADKKAELEKDGYKWYDAAVTEEGCLYLLQVTTQGFYDEIDQELFEYVAKTLAASDLIGMTPATLEEINEFDFSDKGDIVWADGWRMENGGTPYGEVIAFWR